MSRSSVAGVPEALVPIGRNTLIGINIVSAMNVETDEPTDGVSTPSSALESAKRSRSATERHRT
jgi:hypothetical protein